MTNDAIVITKYHVHIRKGEHLFELKIEPRGLYGFAVRVEGHILPGGKVCIFRHPPVLIEASIENAVRHMVNKHLEHDPPLAPVLKLVKKL